MKFLRDAPRWLLLAALVYAPWDYGATTERGIVTLNFMLGAAVLLWIVGLGLRVGRRGGGTPAGISDPGYNARGLPWLMTVPIVFLLGLGWWMAANAHTIYDSEESMFVPVRSLLAWAPGAIDQAVAAAWMLRATALLGTICLVAEACRDPAWLLRLWTTIGTTGGSIALLGLIEKASAAPMIFWRAVPQPVTTFFGTFYYHGNAGAFLNLTLPLTVGLAVRSFARRGRPLMRALWLSLSIISVVASFANTSRMAQLLAALMIIALVVALIPKGFVAIRQIQWTTVFVGFLSLGLALLAVMHAGRLDRSMKRWEGIAETVPLDARWLASQAALGALPDAGWTGFGAGTFHIIFPYYTAGLDQRLRGFWRFLHEDYLQTLLEWGWLGGALWAGLFFGGMAAGTRSSWRASKWERGRKFGQAERQPQHAKSVRSLDFEISVWTPRQRLLLPMVLLGLGSVMLHALVDFPLQIASIQLYVAVYLGICWGSESWGR